MIKTRIQITRRISLKTEAGLVEVWENEKGEVLELHRKNGKLEDIIKSSVTFDECVQALKANGARPLVSRQAIDEGHVAFAA